MNALVRLRRIVALGCLIATTSCGTYWQNRARDLADPFGIGILGGGVLVSVRATHLVQVSCGGDFDIERRLRIVGRKVMTEGAVAGEVGIAPLAHVRWFEEDERLTQKRGIVLGRTYLHGRREARDEHPSAAWTFLPRTRDYERHYDRRMLDLGISVKAIVGLDLDFSPFELADLLVGFFGLDIAGDDQAAAGENGPERCAPAGDRPALASQGVRGATEERTVPGAFASWRS